jgi:hypothetical protein
MTSALIVQITTNQKTMPTINPIHHGFEAEEDDEGSVGAGVRTGVGFGVGLGVGFGVGFGVGIVVGIGVGTGVGGLSDKGKLIKKIRYRNKNSILRFIMFPSYLASKCNVLHLMDIPHNYRSHCCERKNDML